jgi:hypothetical protein
MTNPQLHGHIGGNMDGTKIYDVCIVFSVYADDDDDALNVIRNSLPRSSYPMEWAWIYTTLNKGDASE